VADSKGTKGTGGKQGAEKLSKTLGNGKGSSAMTGNRSATQSEADVSFQHKKFPSFLYKFFRLE
jgi:hypothetical protein